MRKVHLGPSYLTVCYFCFFLTSVHIHGWQRVIMSTATPPSKIRLPPPPSSSDFSDNAVTDSPSNDGRSPSFFTNVPGSRRSARQSFATLRTRRGSRGTVIVHDDVDDVKLPSLVPGIRPAYSTPLPGLPMVVLSIVSLHVRGWLIHRPCAPSSYLPIYVHRSS